MFSKACQYAIRAVLFLAAHNPEGKKVSLAEIATAIDVPHHFLGKNLQLLVRDGLVSSSKGPHGGFWMTSDNLDRSLIDVIQLIDGPGIFQSCVLGLPFCSSANPCPLHVQAMAFRDGLLYQLKHNTIRELGLRIQRESIKL
jgi:Rrf2 family iron-sulfur cluster assembly transcriptional regulator